MAFMFCHRLKSGSADVSKKSLKILKGGGGNQKS